MEVEVLSYIVVESPLFLSINIYPTYIPLQSTHTLTPSLVTLFTPCRVKILDITEVQVQILSTMTVYRQNTTKQTDYFYTTHLETL